MASTILSSAKHGAYLAIGFYVALVLVVSLSAQYQGFVETSLHASKPSAAYAQQVSTAVAKQGAAQGAVGA